MSLSGNDSQLQTLVQINLYRFRYGQFEYLLLKRIDEDDKFWQPVTEKVPAGGSIADIVKKAALEQAGLHGFRHLSQEMYSYEWFAGNERGRDIVFAAEVAPDAAISTDSHRYSTFEWLPYQEAMLRLKWNGNKDALRQLNEHLKAKRLSDPTYWQTTQQGLYNQTTATNKPSTPGQLLPPSATAGNNTPKRLPDQPQASHERKDDTNDVNTSEWFL